MGWESEALTGDFMHAFERVGSGLCPGLDEVARHRLFGLYHRASCGPAPAELPGGMNEQQLRAWRESEDLSEEDAMREYVAIVVSLDADALPEGSDSEGQPLALELLRAQLMAATTEDAAEVEDSATDFLRRTSSIFSAARTGVGLDGPPTTHSNPPPYRRLVDAARV